MNTPAHILINMAVLSRQQWVPEQWVTAAGAALLGALLPDALMFVFYGYERFILETPSNVIWETRYFLPHWQAIFDIFNSIPLAILFFMVGRIKGSIFIQVLAMSMLLHCLLDFPLHNDDAHRHFYPFSDWRFISPFSYWDPAHYGFYFIALEIALGLISGVTLIRTHPHQWVRYLSAIMLLIYVAFGVFAYFVWYRQ